MGSSNSKDAALSSSNGARGRRSRGSRVFQSSCLGGSSGTSSDDDPVFGPLDKENGNSVSEICTGQMESISGPVKSNCQGKARVLQHNQVPSISSNTELDERFQGSVTHNDFGTGSCSTQTAVARSLTPLSRSRSCFNFIPESLSFSLSRATSLGSSGAYSVFSSLLISNPEEGFHAGTGSDSSDGRNETRRVSDFLPSCCGRAVLPCTDFSPPPPQYSDPSSGALPLEPSASALSVHLQKEDVVSPQEVSSSNSGTRTGAAVNRYSQGNYSETENIKIRPSVRRIGAQETVEGSVQFSRTLSVGRLRDRVLCRNSLSDGLFGHLQEDRLEGDTRVGNGSQFRHSVTRRTSSDGNTEMPATSSSNHLPSTSSSTNNSQDYEVETPQLREASNHALVEHRTAFLERRRRIRSQRLGSRFENLSGHDRSCILSGQHRTGRCMCRANSQAANPDEDTSTSASISRIVMLAEALFEVLNEIHQQSVVLSSQPSVSSIGSIPAPKEVVECMPVKIYSKPRKHQNEEVAQCYICLVEYEDGDCMRILPCHHDFHRTCIDKWLKEIHRVCPLCRGDVCRSDLVLSEKVS
ncbi:uncharacterized protein LOC143876982 isoform X2 [Tasmannia lanceolata]|uniref:uncharacterized protein LOC143876982 isoform X2 n=1 Tax=Tasmannia lanceolata TaxID=3420 RepID=UPI0040634B97